MMVRRRAAAVLADVAAAPIAEVSDPLGGVEEDGVVAQHDRRRGRAVFGAQLQQSAMV
jgi:hypothetical protein